MDLDAIADGPIMPSGAGGATPDEPIRPATPPPAEETSADEIGNEETEAPETAEVTPDEPIIATGKAAPAPLELDDDEAEVKLGGETLKVKDIKQQRLAHADYTRKTQEVAREREDHSKYRLDSELRDIQTEDFVTRMDDPNEMINEFATAKPDVWAAVEDYVIQRAVKLADMSEDAKELYLHKEQLARKAWQDARNGRMQKTYEAHKTKAQARAEAQKNHGNWRTEAMKATGLSLTKPEHSELVMEGMASPRNRGKAWTKELFDAEAARVAKILGVKAPKAPKPIAAAPAAPTPAPAPKPALPPVKAHGNAKPVTAARREPKTREMGSFFDRLRSGEA